MPAGNLAVQILHGLYRIETLKGGEISEPDFLDRMLTSNFLFTKTKYATLHPTYTSPLKKEIHSSEKLVKESKQYLSFLGHDLKTVNDLKIKNLTKQEDKILNLLKEQNGKVVSFNKIANKIWGKKIDSKFSLEAIAKSIQNLRTKVVLSGINKNIIHTVRRKGYFLEI